MEDFFVTMLFVFILERLVLKIHFDFIVSNLVLIQQPQFIILKKEENLFWLSQ